MARDDGRRRPSAFVGCLALGLALGCGQAAEESAAPAVASSGDAPRVTRRLDPPAAAGAFAPELTVAGDSLLATWIEPLGPAEGGGHRARFARWREGSWSEPATIAEGDDHFANWADFPAAIEAADGTLWAHWLAKTASDTYSYSIFLARSTDGGRSWEARGTLNDDVTATEHGFVSWVEEGEGVRAFWLDGREMAAGGPMSLRSASIDRAGEVGASELLDPRVCECCATDAAVTAGGAMVVFRDRDDAELRDISAVRRAGAGWSGPEPLSGDGWTIAGCPVNGPEIDAVGERVAVAWFTAAGDAPAVKAAISSDGGETFGPAALIDGGTPLGRVSIALSDGGAWVSWLRQEGEIAEVRLRRLEDDGSLGESRVAALTSPARASGFPRLVELGGRLILAWVELGANGKPAGVRVGEIG